MLPSPLPPQKLVRWTGPSGSEWVQMERPGGEPLCLFCGEAYPREVRDRLGHACCGEECLVALKARARCGPRFCPALRTFCAVLLPYCSGGSNSRA